MSDSSSPVRFDPAAAKRWAERLARFYAGPQDVAAFCAAEGVSESNFYAVEATARPTRPAGGRRCPRRGAAPHHPVPRHADRVGPPVRGRRPLPRRRTPRADRRRPARVGGAAVLTIPPSTKLWFASAVDLRLGFDGLSALVRARLNADPLSGHLFVFTQSLGRPRQGAVLGRPRLVPVVPATGGREVPLPRGDGRRGRADGHPVRHDPRRHRPLPRPPLQTIFRASRLRWRYPPADRGVSSGMDASAFTPDMPLPDDVPTLHALLRQVLAELARLRAENAELRGKLDAALKHRFGRRSERQARPEPPKDGPARRCRPHGRAPLPDHLERREVVHDLTEAEKPCPCCGELARLHRRAGGRATRPGAGQVLRPAHRQEDLRLPALRPGERCPPSNASRPPVPSRSGRSPRGCAAPACWPTPSPPSSPTTSRCTDWPGNWPVRG